ncbi:MAG: alpha/beta hydrolase [Frankia sp.]|nr:alpha/beta hydrolase [Frankia sp.]
MVAWRVVYGSTDQAGEVIATSGVVLAPAGVPPVDARPVVAFGHGTTGVSDACAPSLSQPPLATLGGAFPLVEAGYVVAAADYIGLGTPGDHAIYVARPEGQALLDAARAAMELAPAHARPDVVLWGYSQGGQAALAAGALAASYAPELRVRGVAATAPLADVTAFLRELRDGPDSAAFTVLAAYGQSVANPTAGLADALTPAGHRLLAEARERCAPELIADTAGRGVDGLFYQDPLDGGPLAEGFARQLAEVIAPMAPVLVLQGDLDTVIRQSTTDHVVRGLCAAGTQVEYRRYPLADHGTIYPASLADLLGWIGERFAATPPPVRDICAFG